MRIVVVGGGVAGPAVALAARQHGMEAVVLERRPARGTGREGRREGQGSWLTLAPNGIDAVTALGVRARVEDRGVHTHTNRVFDADGRLLGELPLGVPLADHTVGLTLRRAGLADELLAACERAGVALQRGVAVADVRDEGDQVMAVLDNGTEVAGDVLVGADGVWSRVRTAVDPAAPAPRRVGLANFGGITHDVDGAGLAPGAWHFVFGRRCFFGAHPLPNGDVVWFVNEPRGPVTAEERRTTGESTWREHLLDLVGDDAGPGAAMVSAGRLELAGDDTHDLPRVPTWWRGRIVLVGDAAHAPSPSSGQGAALALEDAVLLARALAADGPVGLATYERQRRDRVERVVAAGARSSSTKIPGPWGRRIRDLGMRLAFRYLVTERSMAWMTGYRVTDEAPSGDVASSSGSHRGWRRVSRGSGRARRR